MDLIKFCSESSWNSACTAHVTNQSKQQLLGDKGEASSDNTGRSHNIISMVNKSLCKTFKANTSEPKDAAALTSPAMAISTELSFQVLPSNKMSCGSKGPSAANRAGPPRGGTSRDPPLVSNLTAHTVSQTPGAILYLAVMKACAQKLGVVDDCLVL